MKREISIWEIIGIWALVAATIVFAVRTAKADAPTLGTNEFKKVAWVDEHGQVNVPEVIGTVARQTTNETKLAIAQAAANSASSAASTATNAIKNAVAQMVANDVHIYRLGSLVSFEALINWDPDRDILAICEFSTNSNRTHQHFGYIASQDIGTTKPRVKFADTLGTGVPVADWEVLPDNQVSGVTVHNEDKDYGGVTYSKWYSIEATDEPDNQHFYAINMDIESPDGDGMTLNISGGFKDCVTETFTDGSLRKTYVGGLLKRIEYVVQ